MNEMCERWEGVASLPRVRQLEAEGMKRKAIAKRFNITTETIRNAEKKDAPAEAEAANRENDTNPVGSSESTHPRSLGASGKKEKENA